MSGRPPWYPAWAWAQMHGWLIACVVWVVAVPVVLVTAPTSVPPLLSSPTAGGEVPTALLVPLLGAGGLAFAVHHEARALLRQSARPLLARQLAWVSASLVPPVLLAALAASQSGQITVGAAERNLLLVSALTLAAATVLPPGLATLPAIGYDTVCLMFGANRTALGLPTPWWSVALERHTNPTQVVVALALLSLAATLHSRRQAH
ncbi:MAG: hypothetical protein ACTHLJ_00545 [Angustibacter sp.]